MSERDSKGRFIKGHKNLCISVKRIEYTCNTCGKKYIQYPCNRRNELNFCSNKCWGKWKISHPEYEIEPELLWALYWGNQYSPSKIGKMFNCGGSCIHNKIIKECIPRRSHSDAGKLLSNEHCIGRKPWNTGKTAEEDPRIPHGESHSNWIDGRTPEIQKIRKSVQMDEWRNSIFERDNFTCQICYDYSRKGHRVIFHAHHIKSFADILKDNCIKTIKDARECRKLWDISNGTTLCYECHYWVHHMNPMNQQ